MTGSMRWLRLGALCLALLVFYFAVPARPRLPADEAVLRLVVTVAALGLLATVIIRQLREELDEDGDHRVDVLVVAVVAVMVVFSLSFYVLARESPNQVAGLHTRVDALYFTMSTLTTVGYGDVHATGQAARALVVAQMVFNLVFLTSAAALLSHRVRNLASERSRSRREARPPDRDQD